MSTGVMEGLQDVLDQANETVAPQNTIPSQDELAAQARLSPRMLAGHRQGKCYVEAYRVEDGIAYRLVGSPKTSQFQWMRASDFDDHFEMWEPASAQRILRMAEKLAALRETLEIATNAMGKRSRRRYSEEMQELINRKTSPRD